MSEGNQDFTDSKFSWPSEEDDLLAADPNWPMVAVLDWPSDPWLVYTNGYRQAANLIHDKVEQTGHDQDFLIWPFIMCWRHHIELQLKNLILLLARYSGPTVGVPITHRIRTVWDMYRSAIHRAGMEDTSDAAQHVERVVLQLDKIDPTAELARYPVDRSGRPADVTHIPRVHFGRFNDAMEAVASYLDGTDTMIREAIEVRNEIASYYAE